MITYVNGDATLPEGPGNKIIAHVVNDQGAMGKGFVVPLMERYPNVKPRYQEWHRVGREDGTKFALGNVQFVEVARASLFEPEVIWVANMVAQHGYRKNYNDPPVKYLDEDALCHALDRLAVFAVQTRSSIHMPKIGCGLAGGKWEDVEEIIKRTLGVYTLDVTVYLV